MPNFQHNTINSALYKTLEELSLSEYETKLYMLSLTMGPSLVASLAKNMGISRPNLYKIVEGLEKKGLAEFSHKKGYNRRFMVASPTVVIDLLREKRKELEHIDQNITQQMPELLDAYKQGEQPTKISILPETIKILDAFDKVFEEAKDEILFLGSADDLTKMVSYSRLEKQIRKRIKRGVHTKLLLFPGEAAETFKKKDKRELRETRVIKNLSHFVTSFYLFANKIIIWQPEAPLAILIEDEYIVQMFKSMFTQLWESTEKSS